MKMTTTLEIQRRLIALGYPLPKYGADGLPGEETATALRAYQGDMGIPVTGKADAATLEKLFPGMPQEPPSPVTVPSSWMPLVPMRGVIIHWTAGGHNPTTFDKSHYHILIAGDGTVIRGTPTIDLNQIPVRKGYAAHTRNCNSGWIGVSLACMAGATESPFNAGSAPMTKAQWDKLPHVLAALCERYSIDVTPKTVLSHAEVQTNLGIAQSGKWDIARLAFDPSVKGAKACGDIFRARTAALL
jgi:hypothetical protein